MIEQQNNRLGFTLLELSIVLVIMGVLLIPALNFLAVSQKSSTVIGVRKDLQIIANALASYYKTNKRLPCPANITLNITDANAGEAIANCPAVSPPHTTNGGNILYGAVPVKTLGISFKYLMDSWGNKYSYYVRKDTTTSPGIMTGTTYIATRDDNIGADNEGSTYAVISHGEDGIGSYAKNGTKDTRTGVGLEDNNIYTNSAKDISSSERLIISKGGINDISISSTGADIINEVVGQNTDGDYFAGSLAIKGDTGNVVINGNLEVNGSIRNVVLKTDTTTRYFSNSWSVGASWGNDTYRKNTKLLVYIYVPMRNQTYNWGGGYTQLQYSINNGSWQDLGHSGYDGPMSYNAQPINSYTNMLFITPNQTSDYLVKFRLRHRAYNHQLIVNGSHGLEGGHNQYHTHLIIQEI